MPDFASSPGGWAAGMSASNVNMMLTVIEEWGDGTVRIFLFLLVFRERMLMPMVDRDYIQAVGLGHNFGLAMTEVMYNATN